jgi:hypothetical protein
MFFMIVSSCSTAQEKVQCFTRDKYGILIEVDCTPSGAWKADEEYHVE